MQFNTRKIWFFCLILPFFFMGQAGAKQTDNTGISNKIARQNVRFGGFQVGDGETLHYQENKPFMPASTLKILTTLLALETLGADFRFTTRLYLDKKNNLYIKGGGDPFLTSETVLEICQRFQRRHPAVKKIHTIFLDTSFYRLDNWQASKEHSDNPYDAPNGALAVNFNTLSIEVAANGTISSGERQTPLLPIMKYKAKLLQLAPGKHRININYKEHTSDVPALLYAGELFAAQFKACGIKIKGELRKKKVPARLTPSLVYQSEKTLKEMLKLLLRHSNNFIANQIFLMVGRQSKTHHSSSTWRAARRQAALFFYGTLHIPQKELLLKEGSGLSLDNRITCRAFISILNAFRPWAELLRKKENILMKSGTMPDTGIFAYAGYFTKEPNTLIPYVLILNQKENNRWKLLQALEKAVW